MLSMRKRHPDDDSASGLYYLSELVEEHTVLTKKILTRLIYTIVATQILLVLIDGFPVLLSLLSIGSHVVYMGNLRHFPTVRLTDPVLILSCGIIDYFTWVNIICANHGKIVLVVSNHFFWFRHFSAPPSPPTYSSRYSNLNRYTYDHLDIPSFTEIASYFGLCVWLVPFSLFVSLSAGENVLPSMGSEYATGDNNRGSMTSGGIGEGLHRREGKAKGLVKAAIDATMGWVIDTGESMGFWRGDKRRF